MSSFVPVSIGYPRLFTRQVLELWDYQWNPVHQCYERVSFRALHMFEPDDNPVDNFEGGEYLPQRPIMLQELQPSVQQRLVPPPRPPPPIFGASPRPGPTVAIPVNPAIPESPASLDGSAYSPTDTPTKRITPSPSPYSPNRLACDRSLYVARQDYQFALPECPDRLPRTPPVPFSAANPPLQPASEPHRARVRRRAPPPPRPVGRGVPYLRPTIPSEDSAFGRPSLPFGRARNLFADFIPNIQTPPSPPPMVRTFPGPRTPSPPLPHIPSSRSPSPDILLELYQQSRYPVDERSHLTIIPSWSRKAPKEEMGECVICYGEKEHLQVQCQNCGCMKVCCTCVVGVYQSINSCSTCRFRGEF